VLQNVCSLNNSVKTTYSMYSEKRRHSFVDDRDIDTSSKKQKLELQPIKKFHKAIEYTNEEKQLLESELKKIELKHSIIIQNIVRYIYWIGIVRYEQIQDNNIFITEGWLEIRGYTRLFSIGCSTKTKKESKLLAQRGIFEILTEKLNIQSPSIEAKIKDVNEFVKIEPLDSSCKLMDVFPDKNGRPINKTPLQFLNEFFSKFSSKYSIRFSKGSITQQKIGDSLFNSVKFTISWVDSNEKKQEFNCVGSHISKTYVEHWVAQKIVHQYFSVLNFPTKTWFAMISHLKKIEPGSIEFFPVSFDNEKKTTSSINDEMEQKLREISELLKS